MLRSASSTVFRPRSAIRNRELRIVKTELADALSGSPASVGESVGGASVGSAAAALLEGSELGVGELSGFASGASTCETALRSGGRGVGSSRFEMKLD